MPIAETTAEPEWIPFRPRAGRAVGGHAGEPWLTEVRRVTDEGGVLAITWLPGDRRLVLQLEEAPAGKPCTRRLAFVDLGTGLRRELARPSEGEELAHAVALDEQRLLAVRRPCGVDGAGTLVEVPLDGSALRPSPVPVAPVGGPAVLRADGVAPSLVLPLAAPASSADDARRGRVLARVTLGATPVVEPLELAPAPRAELAASPDATRLAWIEERDGAHELVVASARGAQARLVTKTDARVRAPVWMMDGRRVLVSANLAPRGSARDGARHGFDLYMVDVDGPLTATGAPLLRPLTTLGGFDGSPAVASDGELLAWVSERGTDGTRGGDVYLARLVEPE